MHRMLAKRRIRRGNLSFALSREGLAMTDKRKRQDRVGSGKLTRRRLVGWGAASSALAFGGTMLAPGPWRIESD